MPIPLPVDATGWPTSEAVLNKIASVVDAIPLTEAQLIELDNALLSVIAEFQAPGSGRTGGTGRLFTPVEETRVFDGNGRPELRVPEIVAGSVVVVSEWDAVLDDVVLKTNYHDTPYETLARQGEGYGWTGTGANFSLGRQNISVTTNWGYALQVPYDVADAVAGEVAARMLSLSLVGTRGLVQTLKEGDVETRQSTTQPLTQATSPLFTWHDRYRATVQQYRDDEQWRVSNLTRRMA